MVSAKCFVILFLVYLNFDIAPLDSAVIPERFDLPDNINENDENSEMYTTTGATEEDIEKIFETYENMYIKNSNWFTDDELAKKTTNEQLSELEDETTTQEPETTEQTADDVVESIHNIMDETIDSKKNRTDRTIVVVVTTNVFNINGSDDSSKRQHTLLSFGTPGMLQKETSTDATLAMHNKITSAFFNSNTSPIEASETAKANNKEESAADDNNIVLEDSVGDPENIPHVAEVDVDIESIPNVTEMEPVPDPTDQPQESQNFTDNGQENEFDIRRLDESPIIQSLILSKKEDSGNLDGDLKNDDSNDILKIMKIIPGRSADESSTGSLSKPFEIPVQEPQDSSLMEAMENILDTDVRKAFERDIPQTHHVPLDINIEEETLYAPLKDLSEYIVEEVEIPVNVDEISKKLAEQSSDNVMNNVRDSDSITEINNSIDGPVPETTIATTDDPTTAAITVEATPSTKITNEKETKTVATDAALLEETGRTTVIEQETASTTDGPIPDATKEHIEGVNEQAELYAPSTTTAEAQDEKLHLQDTEQVEFIDKSNSLDEPALPEHDGQPNSANTAETEENISEIQHTPEPHNEESTSTTTDVQDTFVSELPLPLYNQIQYSSYFKNFEKLDDHSFDEYPTHVHLDTTTEYVTNPNLYIGALFTGDQVAAIMAEAERAQTASYVQIFSSSTDSVEFSTEDSSENTPSSFVDETPSQREVNAVFDSEARLNEDALDDGKNEQDKAEDNFSETEVNPVKAEARLEDHEDKPDEADGTQEKTEEDNLQISQARNFLDQKNEALLEFLERHLKELISTTAKPHGEDVVSEVVKVDEETTELHQIIKKPGVDDATNGTIIELKRIEVTNVESNHLESRSFVENNETVDPLRTLVEAVELTAEITKTVDNFQSFMDPNDSIHLAANQIIEDNDDFELVNSVDELKVDEVPSVWLSAASYIYIAAAILSIVLIAILGAVSYLRFRQFKRNLLFSC